MVNMLAQLGLLSVQENFFTSSRKITSRRKVFPLVGVTDPRPGHLLGVADALLVRVRLNALQRLL